MRPKRSLSGVRAYDLEPEGGVNLANNASLFAPNPAIAATLRSLAPEVARGYPSLGSEKLVAAIAARHRVDARNVVTGNGSSDLIDLLIRAFSDEGSKVAWHPPSFSMIPIWARNNGAHPVGVPLADGFALDVERFASCDARIGFLCRPNNPTGNAFPLQAVEEVAERFGGLLVIDEAYISFATVPSVERLLARDNVAILRSLSKDAGLAGIRLGYALLPPAHAEEVRKVRGPFRVSAITEAIALAALAETAYLEQTVRVVRAERTRVAARLRELGLTPFPSEANFLLFETPWPGTRLAKALAAKGVLVRDFGDPELASCLRVTVGPREANDTFLAKLSELLEEGGP